AFVIARDGLAVAVHPDNPVAALSLQQVADIYTGKITNWQDVGGTDAAITLYGRQSTSGTYVYFRDTVLKDDYSPNMRNMEGTAAIAEAVSTDVSGIGYVGLGYVTGGIQVVSLDGQSPLDAASVASGDYVLTRPLYQYTDGVPPKDGAIGRMIRFTISLDGQVVVESTGFLPISDAQRAENQAVLSQAS
ncbi:MAG: phosphate ABC transporter substrate-binding protein, partial [Candidatus Micrarchaeota archaeon]|nr:phosphate ABC transporter substrate-binding protein [Candidatus Micrarchaeota archaeon]